MREGRQDTSILGSWKCKPPFLRLIVQKKSLVLQFSLQNGAIVQQHQHLLTMESAYFPLFFIISKTLITAYLPPSAYVYNAINFLSPYVICISNSAGFWQWALLILGRN